MMITLVPVFQAVPTIAVSQLSPNHYKVFRYTLKDGANGVVHVNNVADALRKAADYVVPDVHYTFCGGVSS